MQPYMNLNGNSGIVTFEIGPDFIVVQFEKGAQRTYKYDYANTGQDHVEKMKRLARQGYGLNSYINLHVAKAYASKS